MVKKLDKLHIIYVLPIVLIAVLFLWVSPHKQPVQAQLNTKTSTLLLKPHVLAPTDINISLLAQEINQDRVNAGLKPLTMDARLNTSALSKCNDMVRQNYWSHTNPEGVEPWQLMTKQGVPYIHMGENLAEGDKDAPTVNKQWMNSPEHRANILDSQYTAVGYAVCKSNSYARYNNYPALIVVQHFAQL